MLKGLKENDIGEAAELTWSFCVNSAGRSYPLFSGIEDIELEYRSAINNKCSSLVGYYNEEKLIGVLCYFYHPDELYLQTTALVAVEDHNLIINSFLSYISINYSGYEIYVGVTPEYTVVIDTLISFGYQKIEASTDMRLDKSQFIRQAMPNNTIERIDKAHFHEYYNFHKTNFDNIYWNAERLRDKIDDWYIFVNKKDSEITGGLFMQVNREITEIFGMVINDIMDKNSAVSLLSEAIEVVLRENPAINVVIFFVDDKDKNNLYASIECGFEIRSKYCCYSMKL